jgi:uncharacterized membrane protein
MKTLRNAFVTGVLVLVPVLATIDLLRWFVAAIDNSTRDYFPTRFLPFDFQGLGLLIALVLIFVTGVLTQNYVGKALIRFFDAAIRRAPVVGGIYGAIKKFLETVLNPGADQFHGVVLVEFPRQGLYSIGFRTGRPDSKLAAALPGKQLVNIFIPCTPNPTSGFYLLVDEKELTPLDLSVQDAFKAIISMGIVTSEENQDAGA